MSENATVIKEIQSRFTANITDYRKKVEQLSGLASNMTKNLDAVRRTAVSAMKSPSESTQKLGRALDATARKLQGQKTKFDELTKAGERTAQEMDQLTQKLTNMSNAYHAIQAAAFTVDLSTPLQKQADAAKEAVEQIDIKRESLWAALKNAGQNKFVFIDSGEMLSIDQARARLEQLSEAGAKAAERFDCLQSAINAIGTENLGYANAKGLEQLKSKIDATTTKLGRMEDNLSSTSSKAELMADSMRTTKIRLDQQAGSLSKSSRLFNALKNAMSRLGSAAGGGLSAVRNRIAGIGSSARNSTSGVERLLRSIRRISLVSLTLRVVRPIFGELTSCVNRYMEQNKAAAASIERLRNGLTNALAPAINTVINLLNQIMPYLIGIADAVASLITNIFGVGWTSVSTGAGNVADSAGSAADKVGDLADSTNDAANAQEKYNKLIAGFDEITKLEDQTSASGSGSGSGGNGSGGSGGATQTTAPGTEGIAGKLPEWLSDLISDINDLLEEGDFFGIGERIADTLNTATAAIDDWINNTLHPKGVEWASNIAEVLNGLVYGYDWDLLGKTFGDGVVAILDIGDTFLTKVDFAAIGRGVATALNRTLKTINKSKVNFGKIVADLLNAGIDGIWGFVSTVSWSEVGSFIAKNVNRFFESVKWKKAGAAASELIDGLGEMLATAVKNIKWSTIQQAFKEFFETFWENNSVTTNAVLTLVGVSVVFAKSFSLVSSILSALGVGATALGASSSLTIALPITLIIASVTGLTLTHETGESILENGYTDENGKHYNLDSRGQVTSTDYNGRHVQQEEKKWYQKSWSIKDNFNNWKDNFIDWIKNVESKGTPHWQSDTFSSSQTQKAEKSDEASISGWKWLQSLNLFGGLDSSVQNLSDLVNSKIEVGVGLVQDAWTTVKEWVMERAGGIAESAVDLVQSAWTTVKEWVTENIGGKVSEGIELARNNWTTVKDWVTENIGGKVSKGIELVRDAWTTVKDWVTENIGGKVSEGIELVRNAWTTVKDWVTENLGGAVEQGIELARNNWTTVKDWVTDKIGGAIDFLVNLDLPEWLQELLGIDNVDKKVNVSVTGSKNSVYEGIVNSMGGTLTGTVQKTANALLKGSKGSGFSNITTYNSVANKTKTASLKGSKGSGFSNITTYNNTKSKSVSLKVGVKKNGATTVSAKASSGIISGMLKRVLGSLNLFSLKFAARGGIVDSATLFGNTVVGEAGKEAIIPLENHTEWIDKVADRVAQRVGNSGGEQTINVYVTLDGTVVGKSVVRYVNGVAKSTGVNPLSAYI